MAITIKDVAKRAGVSTATVSRIINGRRGYGEETKKRVVTVIEELGYTPNAIARGLVGRETKTIGVLLPKVSGLFAARLLEGMEETARERGYSIFVCHTDSDEERTLQNIRVLREKQVDGLILASQQLTPRQGYELEQMPCPVIFTAAKSPSYPFPYVKVDDWKAAYDGAAYLAENGHKQIAFAGGAASDEIAGVPREEGFRQSLADHSLKVNEKLIVYGDFRFQSGKNCFKKLLLREEPFTAVFAVSDEMAAGVISAAYEEGLSVPEDFSVVGYDNTLAAEMTLPPLTTVSQPLESIGAQAVKLLLKLREDPIFPDREKTVEHSIVERMSVLSANETKGVNVK